MEPTVIRWKGPERPREEDLRARLEAEGLAPYRWSNAPGDRYAPHTHPYHKTLYVVEGSITFHLPALDRSLELGPGDRLELPAGLLHSAVVGPRGVVCLEGHRR